MTKEILIICIEIFLCRILDVSLATVRTVFTVKSKPGYAAVCGFIETLLWFLVVRQALNLDSGGIYTALAYAAGFATGTFAGGLIARLIVKTDMTLQIVTTDCNDELVKTIREAGFGATVLDVRGSEYGREKYMIFCEIPNTRLKELRSIVDTHDKHAFMMVQETKSVFNGYFANPKTK